MNNTKAVDDLVNHIYETMGSYLIQSVDTIGTMVRVKQKRINGYVQKDATQFNALWESYRHGEYLCSMDTLQDAFRAIELVEKFAKRST